MGNVKKHIIYKIYYDKYLAYVGRTNQRLNDRLRGHFFKGPMQREIDIGAVARIEFAELGTDADMYVYEVYLINKEKPLLNRDDKARDELTVSLPPLDFRSYECALMGKWEKALAANEKAANEAEGRAASRELYLRRLRGMFRGGEITQGDYDLMVMAAD